MTISYLRQNHLRRIAVRSHPCRAPFDLRRAGFISLSKSRPADNTGAAGPVIAERDGARRTQATKVVGSNPEPGGPVTSRAVEDMLQELFSSTRRQSAVPPVKSRDLRTEGRKYSKDLTSSRSRHERLTTSVDQVPSKGLSSKVKWAAFMDEYRSQDLKRQHSRSRSNHDSVIEENVSPAPKMERHRMRSLLLRLARVFSRRPSYRAGTLPKPAEAIKLYIKAGIMEDHLWVGVLWILLGAAVKSRAQSLEGEKISRSIDVDVYREQLNNILEVWRLFVDTFAPKSWRSRNATSQDTSSDAASALSDHLAGSHASLDDDLARKSTLETPESAAFHISSHIQLPDRFLSFSPQFRRVSTRRQVSAAAVLTLDLLCPDSQEEINGLPEPYKIDFVQLMAKAVARQYMSFTVAQAYLTTEKVPFQIIDRLRVSWERLPQRATSLNALAEGSSATAASEPLRTLAEGSNATAASEPLRTLAEGSNATAASEPLLTLAEGSSATAASVPLRTPDEKESRPDAFLKGSSLIKAVRLGDANAIDRLWQRMEAQLDRGIILDSLFGQFLWAYISLRRPDQAIHVWNKMTEAGCNPSQNHWLAMLRGYQQARDYNAMRDIWQRMKASGIQPGLRCWTVRIQGLILSGQWAQGLTALDELSKVWDTTALPVAGVQRTLESNTDNHSIQLGGEKFDLLVPSIIPINAAITSLSFVGTAEAIGAYLKWAELQNIQPDTATYNILLRRAVREHRPHDARLILAKMETSDCQPDVHTFTIIIDGLFRNAGSAFKFEDTEAQVATVSDIFRQMKDAGIEPSMHTYSSMLDGLLGTITWGERKQPNVAAARAVLDHMAEEGMKPSPHIYTILMSHYFNARPPDLASIDGLWNCMQLDGASADHILYDRMIEGYARVGAVEKMLAFLRRMPREGKVPGWVALHAVLQSLVKAYEWDMVQDLVRDVGGKDGIFRNASRFSRGRGDFWDLVDDVRRRGIEIQEVEGEK